MRSLASSSSNLSIITHVDFSVYQYFAFLEHLVEAPAPARLSRFKLETLFESSGLVASLKCLDDSSHTSDVDLTGSLENKRGKILTAGAANANVKTVSLMFRLKSRLK